MTTVYVPAVQLVQPMDEPEASKLRPALHILDGFLGSKWRPASAGKVAHLQTFWLPECQEAIAQVGEVRVVLAPSHLLNKSS